MCVVVKGKGIKEKGKNHTPRKNNNKAQNAKNNFNRGSGDMHYLRCGDLLRCDRARGKGCDTSAGFGFKRGRR